MSDSLWNRGLKHVRLLYLHYLSEFAQTHVYWASDALQPSHPLPPVLFPSIYPGIRVFPIESAICIRWLKYWSFSISPFNEYTGLISFRIDWFDLLAVQGTLKSLLQHNSSKASILCHSAFFMVQFSHPFSTTEKTIVWLYRPLMAKWSLWFLIHCLGLSQHFSQGASIF